MRHKTVACRGVLTDEVRRHCAEIAASARHVTIAFDRGELAAGKAGLDETLHFLDGTPDEVARYVFTLDAINFGSGWFEELNTSTDAITQRLTAHAREHGPWSQAQMRALDTRAVAATLGLPDCRLTDLYAQALQQLGGLDLSIPDTADELARRLAGLPFFADTGFYKRAQITANDLQLAGVADFPDIDRLTIFADNLVPHVLRVDGVLSYTDDLARRIDAGIEIPAGSREEQELRACAVHACEHYAQRAGVPPRTLDNWLWNRGQELGGRPHITRTVFY
jgi:hypothetical protein